MRTTLFYPAAALVLAGFLLAGCSLFQGDRTIVSQQPGTPAIETRTYEEGTYALYEVKDPMPRVTVKLQQNEQIGFRRTSAGDLVAVAGSQEYPLLAHETYYWQKR